MMSVRIRLALGVALLAAVAAVPLARAQSPGHYQDFGDARGFLNIVPPGQDGVLNGPEAIAAQGGTFPPHFMDQLGMYGDLVYNAPGLTEDRLLEFYKDASFGVRDDDIDRIYSPTASVTVIRDKSFGVPHIFGDTRYATMFAQGYTGAEDRLFLMDVLRHLGRGRLSEFLGGSQSDIDMDRSQIAIAPYKEADLSAQLQEIHDSGPEGLSGYMDLQAYTDGVNQYINEALSDPSKMPAEYPALQSLLDATSGASTPLPVPHAMSNALVVAGAHTKSGRPIAVFGPQTGYFVPQLLVEKDVHGPDIDARGVAFAGTDLIVQLGRGRDYAFSATSAGADNVDQWVLKLCAPGGGPATTTSTGYLHNGTCVAIEAYDQTEVAKPSAGGPPATGESGGQCANNTDDDFDGFVNDGCPAMGAPEVGPQCQNNTDDDGDGVVNDGCPAVGDVVLTFHVERTLDYGPLVARGKLTDGTPIAIASLRSTYMHELDSARGFFRVNNPNFMTDGYNSFRQAMGTGVDYTFNWFYVDAKDIGYQHSCKCPQRAPGVDPYLPVWGTGEWDWQGFIPLSAQPNDLNPPAGFLTSWNNKQAPQFRSNDRQFSYGPVFRSQMLDVRIRAAITAGPIDRADLVSAMEDAGTCDLRGQEDLPLLLQVLGPTAPGGADPRAQEMRDRLAAWVTTQTHRRDFDHDGSYDDPEAPAIIDAWWTRLSHAMFDANSGNAIQNLGLELDDGNRRGHIGSAFDDAFYSHPNKDLRQVLGLAVTDPWSRTYCGSGVLADCRTALWNAMSQAAADLETEFMSPNVADWKRQIADEDIRHVAVGVTTVPAIEWVNRPTFQQVVQIAQGACGATPLTT